MAVVRGRGLVILFSKDEGTFRSFKRSNRYISIHPMSEADPGLVQGKGEGGGKQFPQCCVTIIVFVLYNTCSSYDCCASISYTNRRPTTNHNSEHDLKTTCSPNPLYLRETLNRFFYNLIIHNKSSRSQFVFLFSLSIKHF